MPLPYKPTEKDGRAVADHNDLKVLKAIRLFGHLRRQEVAMAAWPGSSSRSAYIMACRTVSRLLKSGHLLEKPNTLGGSSLVLAARGVSRLRDFDIHSQAGYDLAFDGPQFFHRTLGTCYLLEKAKSGNEIFGEFALQSGWAPVLKNEFKEQFTKIPDGLITYTKGSFGYSGAIRPADWVEVESAYKPYSEIKKALSVLMGSPNLDKAGYVALHKLVFVFDARHSHDKRVLRAIKRFLNEHKNLAPEYVLPEIVLAKCFVDPPFVWRGVSEVTAYDLIHTPGMRFEDIEALEDTDD